MDTVFVEEVIENALGGAVGLVLHERVELALRAATPRLRRSVARSLRFDEATVEKLLKEAYPAVDRQSRRMGPLEIAQAHVAANRRAAEMRAKIEPSLPARRLIEAEFRLLEGDILSLWRDVVPGLLGVPALPVFQRHATTSGGEAISALVRAVTPHVVGQTSVACIVVALDFWKASVLEFYSNPYFNGGRGEHRLGSLEWLAQKEDGEYKNWARFKSGYYYLQGE